jgi:hypothetical protein
VVAAAEPKAVSSLDVVFGLSAVLSREAPTRTKHKAAFGIIALKPGARLLSAVLSIAQPKRTSPPIARERNPASGGRGCTKRERSAVKRVTSTRV